MGITNTTTVLNVADHDLAVAWYSDLFGREPDRRPMEPSAEWQLTPTTAVMVYADADTAGGGNLILGVDDLDATPPSCTSARSSSSRTRSRRPVPPRRAHRPVRQHRHLRPGPVTVARRRSRCGQAHAKDRAALKPSQFGLPDKARTKKARKETGNYPMPDKGHASAPSASPRRTARPASSPSPTTTRSAAKPTRSSRRRSECGRSGVAGDPPAPGGASGRRPCVIAPDDEVQPNRSPSRDAGSRAPGRQAAGTVRWSREIPWAFAFGPPGGRRRRRVAQEPSYAPTSPTQRANTQPEPPGTAVGPFVRAARVVTSPPATPTAPTPVGSCGRVASRAIPIP